MCIAEIPTGRQASTRPSRRSTFGENNPAGQSREPSSRRKTLSEHPRCTGLNSDANTAEGMVVMCLSVCRLSFGATTGSGTSEESTPHLTRPTSPPRRPALGFWDLHGSLGTSGIGLDHPWARGQHQVLRLSLWPQWMLHPEPKQDEVQGHPYNVRVNHTGGSATVRLSSCRPTMV